MRPPLPEELREIARLWSGSFRVPTVEIAGDTYTRVGPYSDVGVAPHVWKNAHWLYIQHRLEQDLVLVAALGGLVGFVVFSLPDGDRPVLTIHYLYVLRPGRRRGLGRLLFNAARLYADDVPIRTTHTNNYWTRFLKAVM